MSRGDRYLKIVEWSDEDGDGLTCPKGSPASPDP